MQLFSVDCAIATGVYRHVGDTSSFWAAWVESAVIFVNLDIFECMVVEELSRNTASRDCASNLRKCSRVMAYSALEDNRHHGQTKLTIVRPVSWGFGSITIVGVWYGHGLLSMKPAFYALVEIVLTAVIQAGLLRSVLECRTDRRGESGRFPSSSQVK